ncbi:hypothetical protein B0I31_103231 [Saccharothrix carnea]|uniref:Uncharacterized protein n=1 Tax=Saccharothrix carnea TaxID=1280637 RepID=A0A2P8IDE4_SACCR|nr:hypothetical protein [Saccharothrix carnea]PSL56482.1 hypothetical protein B0I31_103231 [Saccharothrix carnea]
MATLLPVAAGPDDWLGWLRAHRRHVAAVLDDGRGGGVSWRPHERQPLGAAGTVFHLGAYAKAVERGLVRRDEKVRVGEWERYCLGDDAAHQAALRALGITSTNGVKADDPRRFVTMDQVVAVMVEGDRAAADLVGVRVGGRPAFLVDALRLVLGRSVDVERYLKDPRLQLEVLGRLPDVPRGYEGRRPWARGTWAGTAAEVNRAHRALAGVPSVREHVGRAFAVLPGIVTVGLCVREAGRVGSAAVLIREVDEPWFARAGELARLVRLALVEPAVLRDFQVSLS